MIFWTFECQSGTASRHLKALKVEGRYKSVPVYMWSAWESKTEVDFCLQLGAKRFLTKPTTDEERLQARIALSALLTKME
jgi:CheY-like chemotaxis protein